MQTLRIFISSPGDVADERQIAGKVIERLQGKYWSFVRLDDVFWEQKVIRSTAHYQDELVKPGDCEMVVGILWSRLGSLMPEKFRKASGERYASGTEWELEMAFEAYEQSLVRTGDPVAAKPDIVIYRRNQPRPHFENPDQETLATAQITRLDAYFRENYWFPDGTIKRPITNYATLEEFEAVLSRNLEELILRQIPGLKPGFEPPPISGSPFKGLQAFDFSDTDRYFGRNREIREIQQRLIANAHKGLPFVLIYGGSGYGKSSLMRAGLAPVLTRPGGSIDEIQGWRRVPFQPAKGEGTLCERLARALLQAPTSKEAEHSRSHKYWPLTGLAEIAGATPAGSWDSAALTRHFSNDGERVFAIAAIVGTLESLNRHILLEIDQLEEIFTIPGLDDAQRSAFLRTIGELCLTGRVWTVATMRSEFFPRVAEQPALLDLVGKDRGYILPPPDRQSLREIIRYPALAARLDFERRIQEIEIAGEKAKHDFLHDQILADAESSPDALPLLEFTLQQLYEEKRDTFLTWDAYAKAGGLKGAIAQRATQVYQTLGPVAQEARHRIFAALVHIDPTRGTVTRQRAPLESLKATPGAESFLSAFLDNHLLVTDEDGQTGQAIVTLAHEALISHWHELSGWLEYHRGDLLARQRLAEQATLWGENGEKKSYLLSEARLAEAERVARSHLFHLTHQETHFLSLSKKRSRDKLNLLKSAVTLFAIIAVAAGFFAWKSNTETQRAIEQERQAQKQKELALVREQEAQRARSTAEGLINSMLYDLKDKLEPLGSLELLDDVSSLAEKYFEENPPQTAAAEREMATMWANRGDVLLSSGELGTARRFYQMSLELRQRLAEADPQSAQAQDDWGKSFDRIGHVASIEGNLVEAREAYQHALEISERLAQSNPDDSEMQRAWSVSIERLGLLSLADGDFVTARQAFQRYITIAQRLAESNPDYRFHFNWIGSLQQLGDVAIAEGDVMVARKAYQQALQIAQDLSEVDSKNAKVQSLWALALNKLGNVASAESEIAAARKFYQQSYAILKRLTEADPQDSELQGMSLSPLTNLGDVAASEGKLDEARKLYQQACEVSQRRAEYDPANIKANSDWSGLLGRLGSIAQAQDDFSSARSNYELALKISQRLAQSNSWNAGLQQAWSIDLDALGELLMNNGEHAEARKHFQKALEIAQPLLETNPRNAWAQRVASSSFSRLGDVATAEGDLASAHMAYQQSLEIALRLAEAYPRNVRDQRHVWDLYWRLANTSEIQNFSDSLEWWQKAYQQITHMKESGILTPSDEQFIEFLKEKATLPEYQ